MVMSPAGLGTKNDCAGEDLQQFDRDQETCRIFISKIKSSCCLWKQWVLILRGKRPQKYCGRNAALFNVITIRQAIDIVTALLYKRLSVTETGGLNARALRKLERFACCCLHRKSPGTWFQHCFYPPPLFCQS
jgi:hypothetical protein